MGSHAFGLIFGVRDEKAVESRKDREMNVGNQGQQQDENAQEQIPEKDNFQHLQALGQIDMRGF